MSVRKENRSFYRLRYPRAERPTVLIGRQQYKVAELSEGGLRIVAMRTPKEIEAILLLTDGTQLEITGRYTRQVGEEAVYNQLDGVSFAVLMSEQRRLAAKRYLCF